MPEQPSAPSTDVVSIIALSAELASLKLEGRREGARWLFRVRTHEAYDEETASPRFTPWTNDWCEAVRELDKCEWVMLHPTAVHPNFAEQVGHLLEERGYGLGRYKKLWNKLLAFTP